jgi:hypothetical protein
VVEVPAEAETAAAGKGPAAALFRRRDAADGRGMVGEGGGADLLSTCVSTPTKKVVIGCFAPALLFLSPAVSPTILCFLSLFLGGWAAAGFWFRFFGVIFQRL